MTDRWPAAWKRPFYGPDVIAQRFIRAGCRLQEKEQMGKTVEEAAKEWIERVPLEPMTTWDQARLEAYIAGAAHGAAMVNPNDQAAAERVILAYKKGELAEGDCKSLLDQLVAHGAKIGAGGDTGDDY